MPTLAEKNVLVENPRNAALKAIVSSRLQDISTNDGKTLLESREEQGVEIADPDAPLVDDIKDSDTGDGLVSSTDHQVDMEDDEFKTNEKQNAEDASEEPEVAATEEPEELEEPEEIETEELEFYQRDGKTFTKIKVNGEEEEIEAHTLKGSYQKDRASFDRFQAAARKEQELEARERALDAERARIAAQPAPQPVQEPTQPEATVNLDTQVEELYDALSYEDEDTVKAKMAKMLSGQVPTNRTEGRETPSTQREQPVNIQAEINAALNERAMQDWEVSKEAALAEWEIEYSDIAENEELRNIADVQSGRIASRHPTQAIELTLQQAGDFARTFVDTKGQPEVTVDPDTKKARKQNAPAPLRTNSKVSARTVDNDKPPTRSETVAQMRAARGQALA
jgi:hypothetical protein